MKKFLLSTLCSLPILCINAFAAPIFSGLIPNDLSPFDKLLLYIFLCGVGIALIGVLFLCIAFFKRSSKKEEPIDSPFDVYLDDEDPSNEDPAEETFEAADDSDEFEHEEEDSIQDDPIIPEVSVEPDNEPESTPEPELLTDSEPEPESEPEVISEPKEDVVYPKLILTHVQTNDFVILPLYPETTVGRKTDNDLVLSDVTISGLHCKILNEDGVVYVLDENSTNGTFINGERISEKTELHHGDKLLLGKQEFSVSINE